MTHASSLCQRLFSVLNLNKNKRANDRLFLVHQLIFRARLVSMPVFRLIGGTKEKPGEPKIAARHKESYRFQDSANLRDE